jgi:hypothetical protein
MWPAIDVGRRRELVVEFAVQHILRIRMISASGLVALDHAGGVAQQCKFRLLVGHGCHLLSLLGFSPIPLAGIVKVIDSGPSADRRH